MALDVKVPSVGESVSEGSIYKWHKNSGDYVEMDDVLVELETDKATVDIVAEGSGVLEVLKSEGETVAVGDLLAKIDTTAKAPTAQKTPDDKTTPASSEPSEIPAPSTTEDTGSPKELSPAVRRMVAEFNLNPAQITGTGRGGRVTKEDVVQYMDSGSPQPTTKPTEKNTTPAISKPFHKAADSERGERREKMSLLRRKTAERMLQAQENAAILTTFNEVNMAPIMSLRKQYKENFKEKYGVGLGFMSFFVKAAVEALQAFPEINGWIEGEEIVYHDYYDIGVAVASNRGLVVPVVRDCDRLSFAGIEASIAEYASKARNGKLTVDEMTGGTFTISNGGVFGSLLSTPILNPPQSAILGMHKIEERPVVENGVIVARPMMYLAMSYDHRIVDGKGAVSFLVKIKECLEDPTRLLLGI